MWSIFKLFKRSKPKPAPISTPMSMYVHKPSSIVATADILPADVVIAPIITGAIDPRLLQDLIAKLEARRLDSVKDIITLGDRNIPVDLAINFLTLSAILTYLKGLLPV